MFELLKFLFETKQITAIKIQNAKIIANNPNRCDLMRTNKTNKILNSI